MGNGTPRDGCLVAVLSGLTLLFAHLLLPCAGQQNCVESTSGSFVASPAASMGTGLRPRGVAVDSTRKRIYALEEGTNLLKAMDLNGGQVWTRSVQGPWNAAVDSTTGRIFVSQYLARAVLVFDTNGNQVLAIGKVAKNFGEPGAFMGPAGLAITGTTLIVTDPENNRFQTFTTAGAFQGVFGRKGFDDDAFGGSRPGPYGVAIHDSTRQIYFADPALNRVSRWAFSGSIPVFQSYFGSAGREPGQLWSPFSVAVNQGNGDVYVSSTNTFRVEVFSGCGNFRGTIGSTDSKAISRCDATPAGQTLFGRNSRPSPDQYSQFNIDYVTVGLRFTVKAAGFLTAVRFIKPTGDTDPHTVTVWDWTSKAALYQEDVQIDGCAGGSWVSMTLTSPVSLTTGKTYVISLDNLDQFVATTNGFSTAVTTGSISIVASSAGLTGANNGAIPTTASNTNYWVDIDFQTTTPAAGSGPAFGFSYGSAFAVPSNGLFYLADASGDAIKAYSVSTGTVVPGPAPTKTTSPPTTTTSPPTSTTTGAMSCNTFPGTGYQTFFTAAETPAILSVTDTRPLALGLRFTTSVSGLITAVRFFKATQEGGTGHSGRIYDSATGTLLAKTITFTDTSCAGPKWVSVPLTTALRTTASVEYTVAIDNIMYYPRTEGYMVNGKTSGNLNAVAGGAVFSTVVDVMPEDTYLTSGDSNYWVDVEFTAGTVTTPAPTPPPTTPPTTSPAPTVAGASTTMQCGNYPGPGYQTIFTITDAPNGASTTDGSRLAIGHRMRTAVAGDITAIRFFKAAGEVGTGHAGKIYNSLTGVLVASTITFTDTSCPGPRWVSAPLTKPFRTTAGTEYTVAVEGVLFYSKTENYLTEAKVNGDLTIMTAGSVYAIVSGVIPRDVINGGLASYFIDVEFVAGSTVVTPAPTAAAAVTAPPTTAVIVTASPTAAIVVTPAPTPAPIATVPPTAAPAPATLQCGTLTPTGYQAFFNSTEKPASLVNTDNKALVLGVRFTTRAAGDITAIRWYKSASEGGTGHNGRIFNSASGAVVAKTITFTDTSCAGLKWVSVPLTAPFRTAANTEYTVAIDTLMYYVKTDNYLVAAKVSGDLTLVAGGSVFGTTAGAIPRSVANGGTSNYWVDVEFIKGGVPTPSPTAAPVQAAQTAPPTTPAPIPATAPLTPAPVPAAQTSPPTAAPTVPATMSCGTFPGIGYQTIFDNTDVPTYFDITDKSKLVLGVRFNTIVAGDVTAFRFFKAKSEGGTGHVGKIYDTYTGALLATSITVSDLSCTGPRWVSIPFTKPFRTTAGASYTLAVDSLLYYNRDFDYFNVASPLASGDLVPEGSVYGVTLGAFPKFYDQEASNYWIDVEFVKGAGTAAAATPPPTPVATPPPTPPPTRTPTPPPTPATQPPTPPPTNPPTPPPTPLPTAAPFQAQTPVDTGAQVSCGTFPDASYQTYFTAAERPTSLDATEKKAMVLGVRFSTANPGTITSFRFYKATSEPGTVHVGNIYDSTSGALLATTGPFSDTSCAGPQWVSVRLTTPLPVQPGPQYTMAVDTVMFYTRTTNFFSLTGAPKKRGDLSFAGTVYGVKSGTMPSFTDRASTNYWVDLEFQA